ncbi:hypothetical protein F885_00947 [Acinetobacter higginsii]|uniref:hypothetical protein n=1 Tax=Acinetobacter higginsii TaxID=70347 RepID=UPI0002CEEFDC|nr:hypothetical protein [Acinetobacter higginsii]ENX62948.1 hypothetical protein F885_00947 [Acinetobacter higginsii]
MEEIISRDDVKDNITLENDELSKKNPHYKNLILAQNLLNFFNKRRVALQVDSHDFDSDFEESSLCLDVIVSTLAENKKVLDKISSSWLNTELNNSGRKIEELPNVSDSNFKLKIKDLENSLAIIVEYIVAMEDFDRAIAISNEWYPNFSRFKANLSESNVLLDDLRNKTIKDLYDEDYYRFNKISNIYEYLFYSLIVVMFLYFLGFNVYISDIDFGVFSIGFSDKKHVADISFYIQKISVLILSTTLAAFLLKRSFMNRRLADESYRTAKELSGFPRYIESLPEEMRNKIRFDLAYKYFGNSIHNDSYTGGENLMHENIKANTEFLKSVKDLSSSKEDKKLNLISNLNIKMDSTKR